MDVAFSKFDISGDKKLDYKEFCDMINSREGQWGGKVGEGWKGGEGEGFCDMINCRGKWGGWSTIDNQKQYHLYLCSTKLFSYAFTNL